MSSTRLLGIGNTGQESSWNSDVDGAMADDNSSQVGLGEAANSLSLSPTDELIKSNEIRRVSSAFGVEAASSKLRILGWPESCITGLEETENTENGPRCWAQSSAEHPSNSTSSAVTAADDNPWSASGSGDRNWRR
jgi:hypothetical protein